MPEPSLLVHGVAGSASGTFALGLLYPLDQVRTYLQLGMMSDTAEERWWKTLYNNSTSVVNHPETMKQHISFLYRGLAPSLITIAVSNFLFFWAYQACRSVLIRRFDKLHKAQPALINLAASAVSGVLNVLLTNPLWVVCTRLKATSTASPLDSMELFRAMGEIYESEGSTALWSGTIPSLFLVSNPIIQFTVYETMKTIVLNRHPKSTKKVLTGSEGFVLGAMAKGVATIATYPLQLVQSRLRTEDCAKTTLECMKSIYSEEGFQGLFQGVNAKMLQTVLTAAVIFASYELILGALNGPNRKHKTKTC